MHPQTEINLGGKQLHKAEKRGSRGIAKKKKMECSTWGCLTGKGKGSQSRKRRGKARGTCQTLSKERPLNLKIGDTGERYHWGGGNGGVKSAHKAGIKEGKKGPWISRGTQKQKHAQGKFCVVSKRSNGAKSPVPEEESKGGEAREGKTNFPQAKI